METEQQTTLYGRRMMDVRIQIAQAHEGLDYVDEITKGDYLIRALDGTVWRVENTAAGWRGREVH